MYDVTSYSEDKKNALEFLAQVFQALVLDDFSNNPYRNRVSVEGFACLDSMLFLYKANKNDLSCYFGQGVVKEIEQCIALYSPKQEPTSESESDEDDICAIFR